MTVGRRDSYEAHQTGDSSQGGTPRRIVVSAAVWSAPVILTTVAAPAATASSACPVITWVTSSGQGPRVNGTASLTARVTDASGAVMVNELVILTLTSQTTNGTGSRAIFTENERDTVTVTTNSAGLVGSEIRGIAEGQITVTARLSNPPQGCNSEGVCLEFGVNGSTCRAGAWQEVSRFVGNTGGCGRTARRD